PKPSSIKDCPGEWMALNQEPRNERAIRLEDYLNDKIQTYADLANLDSVLENLQKAELELENATKASQEYSTRILHQAQEFSNQQADIDRRLLKLTGSQTSDDAIEKFNADFTALRRLDVARGYLELLVEVDKLSADARSNFKVSPQAALKPYLELQDLATALKAAQPAAEGAAPHLIDHVEQMAQMLWSNMKSAFASVFEKTLEKMKWPGKDLTFTGNLRQEWSTGVENLLQLQDPEFKAFNEKYSPTDEPLVLLPLEVMVKPLALRFHFHFSGKRPTNKIDKPEYLFSHIVDLLNNYEEFFSMYLQPILRAHFRNSNLGMTSIFVDSTSAFVTAILPMLRQKISALVPQISNQPHLLSHFVHELMTFDVSLKEQWDYDGGMGTDGWNGLTTEVLVKHGWFGRWLEVEKSFALSRYQSIIDNPRSNEIDYDSVEPNATKPTNAAIRVNDLLETITDRYRPLPDFLQKLKFLIDIQIAIFDLYHTRLHSALEAYQTHTSSIARTVQSVNRESQAEVQGLDGLEWLARIYGSAEYLEKKMGDWSDDVFFLELYDELQDRVQGGSGERNITAAMSLEDVMDKTSRTVGDNGDQGALFDEPAGWYRKLRIKTEGIIQDALNSEFRNSLKPYYRVNTWSSLSSSEDDASSTVASLALTAELDDPLQRLDSYFKFLANALGQAPLRHIARQTASAIQMTLWDKLLMRYQFSSTGVIHFARDIGAICNVIDRYAGEGQAEVGIRKLREALVLLGLPEAKANGASQQWTLNEVEEKVFASNESGREILVELGLEVINESEARAVLERRVDVGT
ncbi:MAG: hypothetical protein Q9214_003265, partial [Letrouitia sp. 1 TL-2023]